MIRCPSGEMTNMPALNVLLYFVVEFNKISLAIIFSSPSITLYHCLIRLCILTSDGSVGHVSVTDFPNALSIKFPERINMCININFISYIWSSNTFKYLVCINFTPKPVQKWIFLPWKTSKSIYKYIFSWWQVVAEKVVRHIAHNQLCIKTGTRLFSVYSI